MIRGYVSSDEDEEDEFYSDPVFRQSKSSSPFPNLPKIHSKEYKEELLSAMNLSRKIDFFYKAIEDDYFGDKIPVLKKLISLGVTLDGPVDSQQWTPLMKAGSLGKCEVVLFLLEQGANPNLHKELFTPLMACCTNTYIPEELKLGCVNHLLQYGAQINLRDKYHTTALMYATGSQYVNIVEKFLSLPDIDLNLQDKEGATALFYAVIHNNLKLVKILIDAGIDKTIKDRFQRTALDIALLKDFIDIAKLLGYSELVNDSDLVPKKENTLSNVLNELPNQSGEGGFQSDVISVLESFLPFKSLDNNNISLELFLNSTETDLSNMGVLFEYERLKLLKCTIHQYHLTAWKRSSMPQISCHDLDIQQVIDVMSAMLKHLTIIGSSLKYLKTRIATRKIRQQIDLNIENDLLSTLIKTYDTAENLKIKLKKIVDHSNEIETCLPHDFIGSSSKGNKKIGISNYKFWFGAVMTFTAFLFYRLRLQYKH